MPAKKAFIVFMLMVLCLLPFKDTIAAPIAIDPIVQDEPPITELSTGIAPTTFDRSELSSLSGSNVTFDPTAGGDDCYAAGEPQTLCFKSESFTTDFEYVYNNWLKFPADWTVSDVYVQGTPVCDNGSWGNFSWSFQTSPYEVNISHNRKQKPTDHCVATYCVDVTPAAGSDPTGVSWYFDGDGFESSPHNPCSDDGYTPEGQNTCDDSTKPVAAVPVCVPRVRLTPAEISSSGCRGASKTQNLTISNLTGAQSTFAITYNKDFSGEIIVPEEITLADGEMTDFDVILAPDFSNGDGEYTVTVTVSDGSYTDQSVIRHTIYTKLHEWQQIETNPIALMDNVLAGYDGKVWSITGFGSSIGVSTYDPVSDTWTLVPESAPPWGGDGYPRSGCQVGNEVFVYGDATGVYEGLWSYNMDTNTWTSETPGGTPPPQTGIWAPAWVADTSTGVCYMTGGATTPGVGDLATVYVYDTVSNTWLTELPAFTGARDFHAAFLFTRPADAHKLLCLAGGVDSTETVLDSTQCYDFSTSSWNAENADLGALPNGWWGMGYAQQEGKLWLVEGADANGSLYNQSAYYDIADNEWVLAGPLPDSPVYRTAAVSLDGVIYHVGGSTGLLSPTGLSHKRVDIYCPTCEFTKQATELVLPGQEIHYLITIDPLGEEPLYVYDNLPASVEFVPGSLSVTPDIGSYGYDPVNRKIWWSSDSTSAVGSGWTPAKESGTSINSDITRHGEEPALLTPSKSVDYAINSILWDQPLGSVSTAAYLSQEYTDIPSNSTFLADDFVATSPWIIDTIFVPGNGWNGFTTLVNASALNFMIYADNGGVPAGYPTGGGQPPVWVYSLSPGDPQITITNGASGKPSNTQLALDVPINLPAGHYWLIFYPTMDFSTGGQYGRQRADTMNFNTARFINPGDSFFCGAEWQSWMCMWGFETDLTFRIEGIKVPSLQIEFDAIVNAPPNQIITNNAFLEFGSHLLQASDDTFTGFGINLPMIFK